MSKPVKYDATPADLPMVKENENAELIDGVLYATPRPASPHARAATRLGLELGGPFDRGRGGPGGWILLDEPELHIVGQIVVPDLAGWRRERMPEMPHTAAFELPPDWLCEVVSPSTAALDRGKKLAVYARAKVSHVWLIDPEARLLEVFRLTADGYLLARASTEAKVRAEPFDAIELELAALWER